jgi:hypothetical protein
MIKRLLRSLGVRREVQRRLDINLEFDDLSDAAGDVRNGARLALVSLRSWLDGADDTIEPDTDWSDDDLDVQALFSSEAYANPVPHVTDACVGERCWFWWQHDGQPLVRGEGLLSSVKPFHSSFGELQCGMNRLYTVMVNGSPLLIADPSK